MKSAKEMSAVIGMTGTYRLEGFSAYVKVLDTRERFGEIDYLVAPIAGEGERWVAGFKVRDLRLEV